MRPLLLAAGLGLFWFVEMQQDGWQADASAWGLVLIGASRLLADLVGGWVAVSAVRVVLALGRLGLACWHNWEAR